MHGEFDLRGIGVGDSAPLADLREGVVRSLGMQCRRERDALFGQLEDPAHVGPPDVAEHRRALGYLRDDQIPTDALLQKRIDDIAILGESRHRRRRRALGKNGSQHGALSGKTRNGHDDERVPAARDIVQRLGHIRRHRPIGDQVVEAELFGDGLDATWRLWHTVCPIPGRTMKFLIPAILGLVLLTGASGPGPLKDAMGNFFTYREELAQMRGEVADLRHGRGSAAPPWVAKYASALCSADAAYVVERTDAALGVTAEDIDAQFQRLHENGQDCTSFRYLGSVGETQFVFVLHHGPKDVWYIFTLSEDGQTIAKVE